MGVVLKCENTGYSINGGKEGQREGSAVSEEKRMGYVPLHATEGLTPDAFYSQGKHSIVRLFKDHTIV